MESKQINKAQQQTYRKSTGAAKSRHKVSKPAYLHRKLQVSRPHDTEEREADAVATEVKRNTSTQPEEAQTKVIPRASAQNIAARAIARQAEEEETQTKLMRQEDEKEEALSTKMWRQEEEQTENSQAPPPAEDQQESSSALLEQRIQNSRGTGNPLPDTVLKEMEQQFGKDFSHVVIHNDNEAAELCKELNARAFTIGSDIYFAPGEFTPETERGRELLAHELTHVVQQKSTIHRKSKAEGGEGTYTRGSGVIIFDNINIPSNYESTYKGKTPLIRHRAFSSDSRTTGQQQTWKNDVDKGGSTAKLNQVLNAHPNIASAPPQRYIFKVPSPHQQIDGASPRYAIGSLEDCARELSIPSWNHSGRSVTPSRGSRITSYDVDHIIEEQIGARSESGRAFQMRSDLDEISNFQLLKDADNSRKMNVIKSAIRSKVSTFKNENVDQYRNKAFSEWSEEALLGHLSVKFLNVAAGDGLDIPEDSLWTEEDIETGSHIQSLISVDEIQYLTIAQMSVRPSHIWIFNGPGGGYKKDIDKNSTRSWRNMFAPFVITSINYETGDPNILMQLSVNVPASNRKIKPFREDKPIDVMSLNGSDQIGYLQRERWSQIMQLRRDGRASDSSGSETSDGLEASVLSPLTLDSIELADEGLVISGQILPTLPLIGDADIRYQISGDAITLSKTFTLSEFNLPAPFEIDSCNLTISAGSRGFGADGRVDFSVNRLGNGYLTGSITSSGGLALEGGLDFDSSLFDRASIDMWYRDNQFGASGTIGIDQPDKIKGIRSANITAEYNEGEFSAEGDVQPDIPGIQQAGLAVAYSEEAGLTIGGNLQLAANPAIRSGSIDVTVNKRGEEWRVSATGSAQPAIPGVDSQLTVSYDDGAFTAEFSGAFQRGMLSGQVTVGASNRVVGEDGRPSGDPLPGGALNIYGSGSATLQIAPWLQGTAGIRFDPNGEVTVSGEIGIPNELEIFARREINKSIFNIAVQAPIFPGIVAEIGGGLSAVAGIGPGVIDELRIGIAYNPAHEEDTRVTGDAHLRVPANAGLRLFVRAGIGLGITGASATGGLEIGGTLGIEGAAEAGVHIDWSPSEGLDLTANLSLHAQPSFTFDISGYVSVRALGFSVYDERWQFASYTFGSDYRFGISLPVHYHEGEPFDISLDDVEFEVPDIDTNQLLRGLIGRIA